MSKWRDNFEVSNSVANLKKAINDAKRGKYQKEIDKALSGVAKGKYGRKGGKK